MKTLRSIVIASITLIYVAFIPNTAIAQVKPGLWEVTGKIQGGKNPLSQIQQNNAKLTPEQAKASQGVPQMSPEMRAQMQAQMQAQMAKLPPEQRRAWKPRWRP
jgi:hypothetical protein